MLEKTDLGHSISLFSIRPNCHAPVRTDWINNPSPKSVHLLVEQAVPSALPLDPLRQHETVLQLGGGDDVVATDTGALAC